MKRIIQFSLLLLLCLPLTALAELPEQLKADFAPISGVVIMPIGEEYLVDLDASANLREGDILTLVTPGEKVIHPVTKDVLGSVDRPKGFLQVTRLKSGYSYAKLLLAATPPENGEQIKRFEQVPASFSSATASEKLFNDLKTGLPQFKWLNPGETTEALVTFTLRQNTLTVKNSSGTTLKSYQYNNDQLVAAKTTASSSSVFQVDADPSRNNRSFLNKSVNNLLDSVGLGSSKSVAGGAGIIRSPEAQKRMGIWMGSSLSGNPVGIAVADLDNDGRQETAIAMETYLLITQISQGKMVEEGRIDLPPGEKLLSIDSLDLDRNGSQELYLTAVREHRLISMCIEYTNSGYQVTINHIPWFLRANELPGEGWVLLGQGMGDYEQPFHQQPFRVTRSGNRLQKGQKFTLPAHANMYSFNSLSDSSNQQFIAYLTKGDYLKVVSAAGTELWESSEYFGGSEANFYNKEDLDGDLINPIYLQQRILRTPAGEILVSQNDGTRRMQRFRMFKNSRIIALNWNGFALQESWRTSSQNGYLADFTLADADNDGSDELVMAVKFKHKTILNPARSTVVIYELNN